MIERAGGVHNAGMYPGANPFGARPEDVEAFYSALGKADSLERSSGDRMMRLISRSPKQEKAIATAMEELKPALDKSRLTVPEKDGVLKTLRHAKKAGVLRDVVDQLQQEKQLQPLYRKMDGPMGAALFLGLITGGVLLLPAAHEAGKSDRQPEMLKLLKAGGIDKAIIQELEPPLPKRPERR